MKNIIAAVFAVFAVPAFAGNITQDTKTGAMVIKTTDSVLVSENVSINLSNNVAAGASAGADGIALATCHEAGRKSAREVPKQVCSGTAPNVTCVNDPDGATETKKGAVMNTATTLAGTVSPDYPNTECNSVNAANSAAKRFQ